MGAQESQLTRLVVSSRSNFLTVRRIAMNRENRRLHKQGEQEDQYSQRFMWQRAQRSALRSASGRIHGVRFSPLDNDPNK